MKMSFGKIIYFTLLILMIFLTARSFIYSNGAREEVENKIVILEEKEVLEENENKLVLLTGKIIPKDTLKFEEYQVEVQSPILERKVEMFQYVEEIDEQDRKIVKRIWSDDIPEDEVYDEIYKEKYYNPDMKIEGETIYGEANLGKFLLDKEITKKLKTNANFNNLKETEDFKKLDEITLTNTKEERTKIGDLRLQFKYLDLEKAGEYTILGKQSGNKIVEYKLDTGLPLLKVFEGIKSKDEILETISKDRKMSIYGSLGVLTLLILIGLFKLKAGSKENITEVSDNDNNKVNEISKDE